MHTLRLFREAFAKRRALIPATGFFEWQKRADGKQPYRFERKDPAGNGFRRPRSSSVVASSASQRP